MSSGDARSALERSLKAEFPDIEIEWDAIQPRIRRLRHLNARTTSTSPEQIARSVLAGPSVARGLGLSTDLHELCQPVTRADPQIEGLAIVRMQQCVNNVRVFGAELVMNVRVTPAPAIDTLTSSLTSALPRTSTPKIDAAAAAKSVSAAFGQGAPVPELIVFNPAMFQLPGPARLCWLVQTDSIAYLVDAIDGTVVHRYASRLR